MGKEASSIAESAPDSVYIFGDSHYSPRPAPGSFPTLLEEALKRTGIAIVNCAVSGQGSKHLPAQIEAAESWGGLPNAAAVIIGIGTNDARRWLTDQEMEDPTLNGCGNQHCCPDGFVCNYTAALNEISSLVPKGTPRTEYSNDRMWDVGRLIGRIVEDSNAKDLHRETHFIDSLSLMADTLGLQSTEDLVAEEVARDVTSADLKVAEVGHICRSASTESLSPYPYYGQGKPFGRLLRDGLHFKLATEGYADTTSPSALLVNAATTVLKDHAGFENVTTLNEPAKYADESAVDAP